MAVLRTVFMGSADLSCASLEALLGDTGVEVVGVVTQPDRPKGRELKPHVSPVKELAQARGLPVLQPARARDENFLAALRSLQPDLIVVAAYGQILPTAVLDLPKWGCLNVHASLLPKYRGAAPIQWAVANGETETGVTIMKMDAGMDTGDILTQERTTIELDDNSETLHRRLAKMGAGLLVRSIPDVVAGKVLPKPQEPLAATYAPKIKKADGRVDWSLPARAILNRIRAFTPWPGAFTSLPAQRQTVLLKIWVAEVAEVCGKPGEIIRADKTGLLVGCGRDALSVLVVQREGGRKMSAQDFLAGQPLKPGMLLGQSQ